MVTSDVYSGMRNFVNKLDDPVNFIAGAATLGGVLVVGEAVIDWAVNNFSPASIGTGPEVDAAAAGLLALLAFMGGSRLSGMAAGVLYAVGLGMVALAGVRAMEALGVPAMLNDFLSNLNLGGGTSAAPRRLPSASQSIRRAPSPAPARSTSRTVSASSGGSGSINYR